MTPNLAASRKTQPPKSKTQSQSVEDLREELLGDLRELGGTGDSWSLEGPVIISRECDIFKAHSPEFPKAVALKRYHKGQVRPRQQAGQFAALKKFHALMSAKDCTIRVPEAFFFKADSRILAMEWIDAPTLHRLLWQSLWQPGRRRALIARAGNWLKHFHEASSPSVMSFDPDKYLQILAERIKSSQTAQSLLEKDAIFEKGLETLNSRSQSLKDRPVSAAASHFDFAPSNLLLSDSLTIGIDIWSRGRAPVYEDICRMITGISTDYPFVPFSGPLSHSGMRRSDEDALFDGLQMKLDKSDLEIYHFILLHQLLRSWIVFRKKTQRFLERYNGKASRGLSERAIAHYFKRRISPLLHEYE